MFVKGIVVCKLKNLFWVILTGQFSIYIRNLIYYICTKLIMKKTKLIIISSNHSDHSISHKYYCTIIYYMGFKMKNIKIYTYIAIYINIIGFIFMKNLAQ